MAEAASFQCFPGEYVLKIYDPVSVVTSSDGTVCIRLQETHIHDMAADLDGWINDGLGYDEPPPTAIKEGNQDDEKGKASEVPQD